jgi:phage tail-like protein
VADALPPLNPDPEADPCRIQPGVGLDLHLIAAATAAADVQIDDCKVPRTFRMRDLLPPRVVNEDETRPDGFLAKFLDALDREANEALERIDCFPTVVDPLRAPPEFLDLLLYNLGNPFTLEEGLTDPEKRRLCLVLFTLYNLKGTCYGIIGAVKILYGINVTECVAANVDCWEMDVDELDISTDLCPTTAYERRSFSLMVDVNLTDRQRQQIRNIVNWCKPASEHFIDFIEPGSSAHVDHWILELSELNVNADLH